MPQLPQSTASAATNRQIHALSTTVCLLTSSDPFVGGQPSTKGWHNRAVFLDPTDSVFFWDNMLRSTHWTCHIRWCVHAERCIELTLSHLNSQLFERQWITPTRCFLLIGLTLQRAIQQQTMHIASSSNHTSDTD